MTGLQEWMTSPVVRALAWALVHFLWQGALIALVPALGLWFCGSARTRYLLAGGALVAMVLAFAITLAICWPAHVSAHGGTAQVGAVYLAPLGPAEGTFIVPRPSSPPGWFVPVWMGGVSLFYLYSLAGWLAATRMKTRGTFAPPAEWQERLKRLADMLGLRRGITLLESCLTDIPVVIGYFRPVILLPVGLLTGLGTAQVEAILIHELAHIRRYDYLVNVMQSLVEGLLFYHPAVWWVSSVMRSEREHCCDDVVVAMQGDARGYAVTLARLELNRGAAREPVLAANGGNLMKRIHRLMQQPEGPRVATPLVSLAALLATATLAFAAWQTQTPPTPPSQRQLIAQVPQTSPLAPRQQRAQEKVPRPELDTAYRKWLNEDVAYIITDAERTSFKQLTTDAEREQFIRQFWLNRDPTPGTIENEFKEEHYRRIAYANAQYASSFPGWKTDRGRIYITYGPPDEIDDHSSGGAYTLPREEGGATITTYPFQQWRYKYIEGMGSNVIMEFVDKARTGEFHLTLDPKEKAMGGEPLEIGVKVEVDPSRHTRRVALSVPLDGQGHATHLQGYITTVSGWSVSAFQEDRNGQKGSFEKLVSLAPGSYRAVFAVKDLVTGDFRGGEIAFNVH